jgi:hypothetical protein
MPFNIANFNSEIAQSGIASPSFFEARILNAPRAVTAMMRQGMAFRIESVNLPGRTLTTLDQNYHGPVRKIPYRFSHGAVTFSVILSRDMREREAFMKWQDFFVGHYRTTQNALPNSPFDTQYYDDGVGEIQIVQYSYPIPPAGKTQPEAKTKDAPKYVESYVLTLHEAYPSNINDISMSWSDDGYAKLSVEIQYRYASELHRTFASSFESEAGKIGRVGGGLPAQYANLPINGAF